MLVRPFILALGLALPARAGAEPARPRPPTTPGAAPRPAVGSIEGGLEPARRAAEIVPGLGFGTPFCSEGRVASDRCEGLGTGVRIGVAAFWRVTPHLAWGGGLEFMGFGVEPPKGLELDRGAGGSIFLGLLGRYYFLDSGALDPFVSLGLGGAALGTSLAERGPTGETARYEETAAGPAIRLGAGLDFFLSPSLRLGPHAAYAKLFTDRIRRCSADRQDDCIDRSTRDYGYLDSYLELTVALTVQLGTEH